MHYLNFILMTFVLFSFGFQRCQKKIVKDIDGNVYGTIIIGTQTWMDDNLRTTRYNDNSSIRLVSNNTDWATPSNPAYCWYNNDKKKYKYTYGALYNWNAVNTNKLCPSGWHVPTEDDFKELSIFLGGDSIAGGKLKEKGTSHWAYPNEGAEDVIRFRALPGGYCTTDGEFINIGIKGYLWTSNAIDVLSACDRTLTKDDRIFHDYHNYKNNGFSIRCLKNK
jgi:uncharacterized protein (TIGR02145 family)